MKKKKKKKKSDIGTLNTSNSFLWERKSVGIVLLSLKYLLLLKLIYNDGSPVLIDADSKGHPTISAAGCSASVASVNIHFHGGAR